MKCRTCSQSVACTLCFQCVCAWCAGDAGISTQASNFPSSAQLVTLLPANTCQQWEPVWRALTLAALWGSRWQFPNESFLMAWGAKTWKSKKKKENERERESARERKLPAVRGCKWWFCFTSPSFFFFLTESKPYWTLSKTSMFGPATRKDSHVIYFLARGCT